MSLRSFPHTMPFYIAFIIQLDIRYNVYEKALSIKFQIRFNYLYLCCDVMTFM